VAVLKHRAIVDPEDATQKTAVEIFSLRPAGKGSIQHSPIGSKLLTGRRRYRFKVEANGTLRWFQGLRALSPIFTRTSTRIGHGDL